MSATAAQIQRLRRMTDEPGTADYDDPTVAEYIERYPLMDERGQKPYTYDTSTSPPTEDANEDWLPTYDINAAAADVWQEKAAAITEDFDFSADGASYQRSQKYQHALEMAAYYRRKRSMATITQRPDVSGIDASYVVNAAEED